MRPSGAVRVFEPCAKATCREQRHAGEDPARAQVRPASVVERYQQ